MTTENSDGEADPDSTDDVSWSWVTPGLSLHDSTGRGQDQTPGSGETLLQEVFPLLQWSDGPPLSQDQW